MKRIKKALASSAGVAVGASAAAWVFVPMGTLMDATEGAAMMRIACVILAVLGGLLGWAIGGEL